MAISTKYSVTLKLQLLSEFTTAPLGGHHLHKAEQKHHLWQNSTANASHFFGSYIHKSHDQCSINTL